ncbi:MAG: ARMT1-like domain-containing protein [Desulfuromonadaceae bacterium]
MDIQLECLPCFVKQTLSVLNMVNADNSTREHIMRDVLAKLSTINFNQSPPEQAQKIHALIRDLCANADPYAAQKQADMELALELYDLVEPEVINALNPFYAALQMSIAGNNLDHGVYHDLSYAEARAFLEQGLHTEIMGDLEQFRTRIERAETILFLGDNAGEIVFDRFLLRQMQQQDVTYAVRGSAIINDALLPDAQQAGIDTLVSTLISNGDNSPGTVLHRCSSEFRRIFDAADLIIAKGQGNYETLSEHPGNIFFLLKAKCPVVARHIGCNLGSALLHRRN